MTNHEHGAMPELLPCPFCGGVCRVSRPTSFDGWSVHCDPCGVVGDEFLYYENAVIAWNRRAAIQQAAGAVPKPRRVTIADARDYLNTNDKAFWVTGWNECAEEILAASPTPPASGGSSDHLVPCAGGGKLWLWKNFVDGRPEYWAFDNPYPIHLDHGDPQTLGEPCGYAIFKPSRTGRTDVSEEQVLRAIARANKTKD